MLGMVLQRFELIDHFDYQLKIKTSAHGQARRPADPRRPRHEAAGSMRRPLDTAGTHSRRSDVRAATAPQGSHRGRCTAHPWRCCTGRISAPAKESRNRLGQEATERGFAVTLGALDDQIDTLRCRRCGRDRVLLLQRRAAGQRRRVSAGGCAMPPPHAMPARAVLHAFSAAATPSGRRPTRPCRSCSTRSWRHTAPARIHARGEGRRPRRLRRPVPQLARRPVARSRHGARAPRRPWPSRTEAGTTAVDRAGQPPGDQPGDHVLSRPASAGAGQPRAARTRRAATADRSTRHVEIALPAGATYRAGDHLGVLPRNSPDLIRRVMQRFALDAGMYVTITPNQGSAHPPADRGAGAAARRPRQLRRTAGRRDERRHRGPRRTTRPTRSASALQNAHRRRREVPGPLPGSGAAAQPLRPGSAGGVPCLRPAVRGLSRPAATAAAPLLLDLLLAHGQSAGVQHHGRGAQRARAVGHGRFRRRLLESPRPQWPEQHAVRFVRPTDDRVPAARQPARTHDHGRGRDGSGARSAASCRSGRRWSIRAFRSAGRCCSSAAAAPRSTISTRRNCAV